VITQAAITTIAYKKGVAMNELAIKIVQYEQDELDGLEIIKLFQELIDNGMAWKLQGHYGRMATDLIESGYCHYAEEA
jgi:hypothetical protein